MYAGGLLSPTQRCFSDLVCQPLVTSYVIDAYLMLAMYVARLDHRVPAHDVLRLTVDIPTKAERQWPDGEDRMVVLATVAEQGSGGCQRSTAAIYAVES